jgi:hypothetical protein
MTQDTINLILGASIAFIASALTSIISYIFQSKNEQKKREWQLEDLSRQERKIIFEKRFDQIELFVTEYMKWGYHISTKIVQVTNMKDVQDFISAVEPLLDYSHLLAFSSIFDDVELTTSLHEFDKYGGKIIQLFSELGPDPSEEKRISYTAKILGAISALDGSGKIVFRRLDQLRLTYLTDKSKQTNEI